MADAPPPPPPITLSPDIAKAFQDHMEETRAIRASLQSIEKMLKVLYDRSEERGLFRSTGS